MLNYTIGPTATTNRMQLVPYHHFTVDGRAYVVTIDRFRCYRLDDRTDIFLSAWEKDSSLEPADDVLKTLEKKGLLAKDQGEIGIDSDSRLARDLRAAAMWIDSSDARTSSLILMVAQECNMACIYCYGNAGTYGGSGRMTFETACRSVNWLIHHSGDKQELSLSFFGGEPLLNLPVIRSTVAYAKQLGEQQSKTFKFSITTNASLINDTVIDFLRENDFNVLISFDGTSAAQDKQRPFKNGSPSYAAVVPKIKQLLAAYPQANGRATLYGDTDPGEVMRAMKEMGFNTCSMVAASGCVLTDEPSEEALFKRGDKWAADLQQEAVTFVSTVKKRNAAEAAQLLKSSELSTIVSKRDGIYNDRRLFYCGAGRNSLAVDVDGSLYPCHRFVGLQDHRLGSINEAEDPPRGLFHESPVVNSESCRKCWLKYVCGGGCMYENVSSTGKPMQPDPALCRQYSQNMETMLDAVAQLNDDDIEFLYQSNVVTRPYCPLDY